MKRIRKYKSYIIIAVMILVLILFVRVSGFERDSLTKPERMVRNVLAPLQSGVTAVTGETAGFLKGFLNYKSIQAENERLKEEIEELKGKQSLLEEYRQENSRLRKLLEIEGMIGENFQLKAARVIARNPDDWYNTIIINKGEKEGFKKNMAVINDAGLVGRIINVTENTSEVLLILDNEGAVGAMIQQTRVPGIVEGVDPNSKQLEMIHLPHDAPVHINSTVVSSGLGGVFPKGIRIGYITEIVPEANGLVKRAIIQPFVDFDTLEEVMVITGVEN